jgi:hypothetical protein
MASIYEAPCPDTQVRDRGLLCPVFQEGDKRTQQIGTVDGFATS